MADSTKLEDDRDEDVGNLGVFALSRRCAKIFWTRRRVLPVVVLYTVVMLSLEVRPLQTGNYPAFIALARAIEVDIGRWTGSNATQFDYSTSETKSAIFTAFFSDPPLSLLLTIPYLYVVHFMTSNSLSDKSGLWEALVHMRKRMNNLGRALWTTACGFLLYLGVIVLTVSILHAAHRLSSIVLVIAAGLIEGVLILGFWYAFQLVLVVAALEKLDKFRVLKRSWELLRGKKWVAFEMMCLKLLVMYSTVSVCRFISQSILRNDNPAGNTNWPTIMDLHGAFWSALLGSVSFMLMVGTDTVLYLSCKALRHEILADLDDSQNEVTQGEYEQIPDQPDTSNAEV